MGKVVFEMEPEQVDAVVIQELKNDYEYFKENLEKRSRNEGLAIFDSDPVLDCEHLIEHIYAHELVLAYYGEIV
jgi:hypothetical protein